LLKNKKRIFDRLLNTGLGFKKPESRKASSQECLFGVSPIIDADFIEVNGEFSQDSFSKAYSESTPNSESIDPDLLENLREYLKTRSQEEITEIFEEINKILEKKASKGELKETLKNAFRVCSETASSKASSIASNGKESLKVSSKMLSNKWNNLSPGDRKIISEVIITLIEIGLLKSSSKGKKAAFVILSSISRHQTPGRKDLEELVEGFQKLLKRRS
jgi:hypothetical protein